MAVGQSGNSIWSRARQEMSLLAGVLTLLAFLLLGQGWLTGMSGLWAPLGLFLWLFAAMLWLSFSVVHHADCLAIKLGEPYGTLILTLSVISIEVVMISAIMLTGSESPGVGRDMMFAVLMIVLNGLVGLSLLCGSLRHLEQAHNLQGANIFLAVLLPLAVLGLVLPNVTQSTEAGTYSNIQMLFAILASISLYGAFLAAQTLRHRGHFVAPGEDADSGHDHGDLEVHSTGFHAVMLLANMLPIVLLSKSMAKVIDYGIDAFAAPVALGGVVIAILVLAPEGMAAVNAALSNQLQRSINICLGSALATIGMTIPAILIIGLSTGTPVVLGLEPVETVMLFATILASLNTFASNRTTVVHGVVHLVLFFAYLLMVFD